MTLCLKGTPRKGKLGSSSDGLNLFYIFSYIYRYEYICVYIYTNQCMLAHVSFWEQKVQEVEITFNK